MKILIFSTAYFPFIGGAEVAVDEITKRLTEYDFDLITAKIKPNLPSQESYNRVNIYRVGFGAKIDKFLLPILGLIKAIKLNKKRNYQIIWAIMASQAGVTASFFKIIYPNKKMILNIQEGDPESYLQRYVLGIKFLYKIFIRPWHILPFKKADYITAISDYLRKRAIRSGAKCPIKRVPNGVNLTKILDSDSLKLSESYYEKLKKKLKIKPEDKIVITTSRLVKKNGIEDLIKAISILPKDIKCLIAGDGPDRTKLENLAKQLKVEDRIFFLGQINHSEVFKYLKISDVFVRPSLSEGLGNSFLEAMAVGIPVIGTPVGGIPDFLKDGKTGFFCKVRDSFSIAEKIAKILKDEKLKNRLCENAKELVFKNYNWDNIAKQMDEIFRILDVPSSYLPPS